MDVVTPNPELHRRRLVCRRRVGRRDRAREDISETEMDAPFGWLTGACLAVSKRVWQATGGFDPDYFLYWEDVDYSQRAKAVGLDWWCAMTSS